MKLNSKPSKVSASSRLKLLRAFKSNLEGLCIKKPAYQLITLLEVGNDQIGLCSQELIHPPRMKFPRTLGIVCHTDSDAAPFLGQFRLDIAVADIEQCRTG